MFLVDPIEETELIHETLSYVAFVAAVVSRIRGDDKFLAMSFLLMYYARKPVYYPRECECGFDFGHFSRFLEKIPAFESTWVIGVVVLLVVYLIRKMLYRVLLYLSLSARGVKRVVPEAMRAGSAFEESQIPNYQLSVCEAGIFKNSHMGYAIRFGRVLIVPRHVIYAGGWPTSKLIVKSYLGKEIELAGKMEESSQFDLAYFYLTDAQWATVGARSASLSNRSVDECRVSCSGFSGKSRGILRKTNMIGQYSYDGSTKAGYSGAAYVVPEFGVVGIHVGVDGDNNVGIASVLILREIEHLIFAESRRNHGVTGLAAYDAPAELVDPIKKWDDQDVLDIMYASREGDETAHEWLKINQDKHGQHRYYWESKKQAEPKMQPEQLVQMQRVFNQVFEGMQAEKCDCKSLKHTCREKKGRVNIVENVVGQSDVPTVAPQGMTDVALSRQSMLEMILDVEDRMDRIERANKSYVEDHDEVVARLAETVAENHNEMEIRLEDTEDHGLRALGEVELIGSRLESLELWAIDRGYAKLPSFLGEGSPQWEALQNRKKSHTPDLPLVDRREATHLTYKGESSRRVVTPPMIRKLKKAVRPEVPVPREIEMTTRPPIVKQTPIPPEVNLSTLMRKEILSDEEKNWLTRILRSRKKKQRKARKSAAVETAVSKRNMNSCAATSSSSGKSAPSTSSRTGPSSGPGPSTSQN